MIKNERQYRITRTQAQRFAQTLHGLRERPEAVDGVHPIIAQAQVDTGHLQPVVGNPLIDLVRPRLQFGSIPVGGRIVR